MSENAQYNEFFEDIKENVERLVRCGDNEVVSWRQIFAYLNDPKNSAFLKDLAEDTALVIYDRVEESIQ